jgi:gluconate 2-dehydrogenase gamma chain
MADISRRSMIKRTGAVGAAMLPFATATERASAAAEHGNDHNQPPAPSIASNVTTPQTSGSPAQQTTYLFFNTEEAAFIEAAVARLIPKDDQWGGAIETGVPNFMDKQLGGAWGAGERLYRSGPWQPGTPSQGNQLQFTPAELFRTALAAINKSLASTPFAQMSPEHTCSSTTSGNARLKDISAIRSTAEIATWCRGA